ncbi:MAG: Guanylate kinase [Chlamydiota bacterium]|jgi:guanylate kinase
MEQVLGNRQRGLIFVISAPAGTGKTTLVRMLSQEFSCVVESISYTTRPPRATEINGRDYFFVTQAEFQRKIAADDFLEYAQVFGEYYGTSKAYVEETISQGKHIVLVIDTQGALQLMGFLEATFIFISPPDLMELKSRLHRRRSESEEVIDRRLSWAEKEMELAKRYDYHIVNKNLDIAYQVLRAILIAEEHTNFEEKC